MKDIIKYIGNNKQKIESGTPPIKLYYERNK